MMTMIDINLWELLLFLEIFWKILKSPAMWSFLIVCVVLVWLMREWSK